MRDLGLPQDGQPETAAQEDRGQFIRRIARRDRKEIEGFETNRGYGQGVSAENGRSTVEAHFLSLMTYMAFQCFQLKNVVNQLEMHHIAIPDLAKAIEGKADKFSW